jgi:preprotein translocase subunit SecG
MQNVLLVAYLLIVLALIAVILLQRSEGGGLGMGGNAGGLMTVRGSANLLTRTTAILAALFFATAIGLTILSELDRGTDSILDNAVSTGPQPSTVLDALSQMQGDTSSSAPASSAAPADQGLTLPVTPAPSDVTAPSSSAAAPTSSSAAPPASSAAPAPSSAPAPSDAAPAASSAPAQ